MRLPRGVNALLSVLLLVLVIGLAVLAVLQYRWIDRVSEAEHQRMRANIDFAARRLVEEFREELGTLFDRFARPEGPDVARRYEEWSRTAPHPELVSDIYVIEREEEETWTLRRLDLDSLQLVEAPWPAPLAELRRQIDAAAGGGRIRWPPPMIEEGLFIAPLRGMPPDAELPPFAIPPAIFLQLNDAEIRESILPQLVTRHFSTGTDSYRVAVMRGTDVIYRSDAAWPDGRTPPDAELSFMPMDPRPRGREGGRGFGPPMRPGPGIEPWRLLVRRRDGGLESLVAVARRRNLALSFGTLSILAATMFLLFALLRRADRLRAQQAQFVAAMTHELNTPIAALRSAGENLRDGIVADREKLGRYGESIIKESSRLGEMVAQVLDFAGIQARSSRAPREPIDVAAMLDEAVSQCRWLIDGNAIDVETNVDADLPPVHGDAEALTRAVQNLVANAIRHGGAGKWVGLRASRNGNRGVAITVEDRGPGIDGRDAARLFEPFYRGRNSGRVRGTGLGLAIVQQIARAHGGSVEVDRRRSSGAAFTLYLPPAVDHA